MSTSEPRFSAEQLIDDVMPAIVPLLPERLKAPQYRGYIEDGLIEAYNAAYGPELDARGVIQLAEEIIGGEG